MRSLRSANKSLFNVFLSVILIFTVEGIFLMSHLHCGTICLSNVRNCQSLAEVKNKVKNRTFSSWRTYNYQNPSVTGFLMLIRAIGPCSPLGLQNLNLKRKMK